ncbi:hypothetical protein [Bacillus sp. FJAT-26390]|uniref:hypothetical protein n=1 Tax=Bacillus sp. FJAT-26390 TaxID=1743142 RepID=UPI00080803D9|nr:hypothetical protein [Bacillus sp. FJAT-26390]OBZ13336.1 hypothetical protein A7975_10790 [Bacillus sp. FJAT-26390]
MEKNNDVVMITLDTERELRYGHKALKRLAAKTGKSVESLIDGELDMNIMEEIIFYGLESDDKKNHGGKLELKDMEDLLDLAPTPKYYLDKMTQAMTNAFGQQEGAEGNAGK